MLGLGLFLMWGVRAAAIETDRVRELWGWVGNNIFNLNKGNVGIGTSGPGQKLEVAGNVLISGKNSLMMGDDSFGVQRQNWGDLGEYLVLKGDAGFAWVQTRNNSAAMVLRSNGNLAIGSTAAGYRLTVAGDGSVTNGVHPVASFTKNYTNGVYVGYKADGTRATAGVIFTDNQLPLVLGSSSGEDYVKIERTKMEAGGGIKINATNNPRPGCLESERGMLWFTRGVGASGPTAKDVVEVCARDAGGASNWRALY